MCHIFNEYKKNSLPKQTFTIKVRQHLLTPLQQTPERKKKKAMGNLSTRESKSRPTCYAGAQTKIKLRILLRGLLLMWLCQFTKWMLLPAPSKRIQK